MKENKSRNDPWSREELILALNFYFNTNPLHISVSNSKLLQLCAEINSVNTLRNRLGLSDHTTIRNANSVYMKLCNFLRLDPNYSGIGLSKGSKLEEKIWTEFNNDIPYLANIANSITEVTNKKIKVSESDIERNSILTKPEDEAREGALLFKLHKIYERDTKIIKAKKRDVIIEKGELSCEICGFNFERAYGEIGKDFIECHHITPLYKYAERKITHLDDLILVCSNCHRMLHRYIDTKTPDDLKKQVVNLYGR